MADISGVFFRIVHSITGGTNPSRLNRTWLKKNPVVVGRYNFGLTEGFRDALRTRLSNEYTFFSTFDLTKLVHEQICDSGSNPLRTFAVDRKLDIEEGFWGFALPAGSQKYLLANLGPDVLATMNSRLTNIRAQSNDGQLIYKDMLAIGLSQNPGNMMDYFQAGADYFAANDELAEKLPKILFQVSEIFGIAKPTILLVSSETDLLKLGTEQQNKNHILVKEGTNYIEIPNRANQILRAKNEKEFMRHISFYSNRINIIIGIGILGIEVIKSARQGIPLEKRVLS